MQLLTHDTAVAPAAAAAPCSCWCPGHRRHVSPMRLHPQRQSLQSGSSNSSSRTEVDYAAASQEIPDDPRLG